MTGCMYCVVEGQSGFDLDNSHNIEGEERKVKKEPRLTRWGDWPELESPEPSEGFE